MWEVITDPSAEAFLPTMMLVQEVLLPLGAISVSCAADVAETATTAAKAMVLIIRLFMMSFGKPKLLQNYNIYPIFLAFSSKIIIFADKNQVLTMNKLLLLLVLLAVVIVIWAMNGRSPGNDAFKNLGNDEFEQLLTDSNVVLLDVRTQSEFEEGHLRDAILIDVKTDSFMMAARDRLPKEKIIAVYCRSGRRSVAAAERLAADGYQVVNLKGGIQSWKAAGKEVVK